MNNQDPTEDELKTMDGEDPIRLNESMEHSYSHSAPAPSTLDAHQIPSDPFTALTQSFKPKRAVSYVRVSTRDQAERGGREDGFSLPAQSTANKKKARSIGAEVVKEFVERGVSGTSTKRPALQEMLKYLEEEASNVDYLIVHKLDRLARSRHDDAILNARFDELGVRLISTSENIDQTPAGMLMHGIMSSIAEFYSRNLAHEVMKGMASKVESGGTPTKAPIGYLNHRVLTNGVEERTVRVDPERGPLISWAFTAYSSGEWTLESLHKELTSRGLTSVPSPRRPSKPIGMTTLNTILRNEYYLGKVRFRGAVYDGSHDPLMDEETFETVQAVLSSRINGERDRVHRHPLKSTLRCGECNSRMIVNTVPKKNGKIYKYFHCIGRHNNLTSCKMPYLPLEFAEEEVQKIHNRIQITSEYRATLGEALYQAISSMRKDADQERIQHQRTLEMVQRQQKKLLEAHYNDAISVELLGEEQKRLQREHDLITRKLKVIDTESAEAHELIDLALDLAVDCGYAYRIAPDHLKKILNQSLFENILVYVDELGDHYVEEQLNPPFDVLLSGETRGIVGRSRQETAKEPAPKGELSAVFDRSADSKLALNVSCSLNRLVEPAGIEPASDLDFRGLLRV